MGHLVRRFFQSLSRRVPEAAETADLRGVMTPSEYALWRSMSASDQRHSLKVVARFRQRLSDATPAEVVGVALHDVGKVESGLGTIWRVIALLATGLLLVATSAVYARAARAQPQGPGLAPPR